MTYTRTLTVMTLLAAFLAPPCLVPAQDRAEVELRAAIETETVKGDLKGAIALYSKLAKSSNRSVAAKALIQMGQCYEKLGEAQAREARATYERVVREFSDQAEIVAQARARLAALGRPGGSNELVARQILRDTANVSGVLSADGKYLRRIDGATGDVLQFDIASGQTSRITNQGGPEAKVPPFGNQTFSRDGKQIAEDVSKDGSYLLRVRNPDGSGLRTLYSEKEFYVMPLEWSPDAGSILALRTGTAGERPIELILISTADGSVRILTTMRTGGFYRQRAGFSPDGQSVAFSYIREGNPPHADVFLMTADARNEVVVAGHPTEDRLLGWTPDGRGLIFLSDRSGTFDIWTVRVAGAKQQGEPEVLKRNFGVDAEVLGVAPNGSLYYQTATALGRLYDGTIDLETGKVVDPPAPIATRYTSPVAQPTWSPDGRNLAYISHPGAVGPGNNILTIRSAATGEERFLSPRLQSVSFISWAADSRSMIVRGRTPTGSVPVRIDTETGEFTKLDGGNTWPHLSPDGKALVFLTPDSIRKRNLDTGAETEVVKISKVSFDLSPDGQDVVFLADGAVKTVSLNGGQPRELYRGPAQSYGLEWTRDGRYIIALARGTANSEIWRIPAQGGMPLKLDLSVPKLEFFTLHPDGRRFAFSVNEGSRRELWVLENFLPAPKTAKQ